MTQQNQQDPTRKNMPEVQPPLVPHRNLPEHEVQADKEGPRAYKADPRSNSNNQAIEPTAPKINEEQAP